MSREPRWLSRMSLAARHRFAAEKPPDGPRPSRDEVQTELADLGRLAQKAALLAASAERMVLAAERREAEMLGMLEHHRSSLERIREVHKQAQIAEVAAATKLRDRVAKARS